MSNSVLATSNTADRDEAVARAERIRAGIRSMSELQQDIADAYHARDWETLGYQTWDAYVTGEFGGAMPRLDRAERRELVVNLRAEGLSTRAIGAATGQSAMQVSRDLRSPGVTKVTPDPEMVPPGEAEIRHQAVSRGIAHLQQGRAAEREASKVVGIDGKTYTSKQPSPTPDEEPELPNEENAPRTTARPTTRKTPLPKHAADKVNEVWRLTDSLLRVIKDERFQTNRDSIRERCESELKLAEANLAAFRESLGIEKAASDS